LAFAVEFEQTWGVQMAVDEEALPVGTELLEVRV